MRAEVEERSLAPELTLLDVRDGLIWQKDGRVSLVYRLTALHEPGLSDEDFNRLALLAEDAWSGVPEGCSYQFHVLVEHRRGLQALERALPALRVTDDRTRLLEELRVAKVAELTRPQVTAGGLSLVQHRDHYFTATFKPRLLDVPAWRDWAARLRHAAGRIVGRRGGGDWRSSQDKYARAYERILAEAATFDRRVGAALLHMGLAFERLPDDELLGLFYRLLNPTASATALGEDLRWVDRQREGAPRSLLAECPFAADDSPAYRLLGDDLLVRRESLQIGGTYMAALSLHELPDRTHPGILVPLLSLPGRERYALCYRVEVPRASQAIAELRARALLAAGLRMKNFLVENDRVDARAEAVQKQADAAVEKVISTTQRICGISLQLLLYEKTPERLEQAVQETLATMSKAHGLRGYRETFLLKKAYLSTLPGAATIVERRRKALSSVVADCMPCFDFAAGSGHIPFLNPQQGLVLYDPYSPSLPNANILVVGTSGSGKSFLASTILSTYDVACAARGEPPPYTFILDNGASYKRYIEARGSDARYVAFNLDEALGIDIWEWDETEESLNTHVSRLESLLCDLLRVEEGSGEDQQRRQSLLQQALFSLYREDHPRTTEGFAAVLGGLPGGEALAQNLYPYREGKFARLLAADARLALSEGVHCVCYDFLNLAEHRDFPAVALRLVIYQVRKWASRLSRRGHRTFLLIDESWALLDAASGYAGIGAAGAGFIASSVRMGRKEGWSVVSISQALGDYLSTPYAAAIVGNAATKLIGLCDAGQTEDLREHLRLTDRQLDQVRRLAHTDAFHEFLLLQGDKADVIRVPGDAFSRWLFTTRQDDRQRFARLQAEQPQMSVLEQVRLLAQEDGLKTMEMAKE